MMSAMCNMTDTVTFSRGEMTELVRGRDEDLMRRVAPLVRQHDVALDLRDVERIDAAGIAALISLYGNAQEDGTPVYGFQCLFAGDGDTGAGGIGPDFAGAECGGTEQRALPGAACGVKRGRCCLAHGVQSFRFDLFICQREWMHAGQASFL